MRNRRALTWCLACAACAWLTACTHSTRPTAKIALVAPFEGRFRELGYEVVAAVRLAVRDANAGGGVAGLSVELVAIDDLGDEAGATEQAQKVAIDPEVLVVIGHWLGETSAAAAPVYARHGIPYLATTGGPLRAHTARTWLVYPDDQALYATLTQLEQLTGRPTSFCLCGVDAAPDDLSESSDEIVVGPPEWGLMQFWNLHQAEGAYFLAPAPSPLDIVGADAFVSHFSESGADAQPGPYALLAYDLTRLSLAAIEHAAVDGAVPTRSAVNAALTNIRFHGLAGDYAFDSDHRLERSPAQLYRWVDGARVPAVEQPPP